eukprot:9237680-Alexandrium_andersonii.AAC.1
MATCAVCHQPVGEARETDLCGHVVHEACADRRRTRRGPAASCPSRGPEYAIVADGPGPKEEHPHA